MHLLFLAAAAAPWWSGVALLTAAPEAESPVSVVPDECQAFTVCVAARTDLTIRPHTEEVRQTLPLTTYEPPGGTRQWGLQPK